MFSGEESNPIPDPNKPPSRADEEPEQSSRLWTQANLNPSPDSESPFQNLLGALSYPEQERRKADRRQNDRSGKYDRRRNRCARCKHFAPPENEGEILGKCLAHNSPMTAIAYACPVFESLPTSFPTF